MMAASGRKRGTCARGAAFAAAYREPSAYVTELRAVTEIAKRLCAQTSQDVSTWPELVAALDIIRGIAPQSTTPPSDPAHTSPS